MALLVLSISHDVHAQPVPSAPPIAATPGTSVPRNGQPPAIPSVSSAVTGPAASNPATTPVAPPKPGAATAQKFYFQELRVEGNTVLSEREIDEATYQFLGPDRTAEDVEKARTALDDLLTRKGYITVSATVPPQDARSGVVRIRIVERSVGRLRVTGAQYVAPSVIKRGAPSLAEGTIPRLSDVQSDIVALNQYPDRTITPSIRQGRAPDTVDVDLKVEDKLPLHGSLEINDRQSLDTTPLRLSGNVSYDNLWQRGDSVSVGFQLAPENTADTSVVTGSYLFHIPGSKASILGNFIHSDSNVSTVGSTNVVGKGDIAGLRLQLPLGTTEDFTHSLSAGFDYKNLTENTTFGGQSSLTPVTYYPLSVTYQAGWTGTASSTDASLGLVWTFRGLDSGYAQFDAKRFDAPRGFVVIKGDASRTQGLPYGMQGYAHISAQVSPDPLVSSEQYSLGGLDSVRGYLESETLGDYGGSGQIELRSPDLARRLHGGNVLTSLRLHAFVDAGATAIREPLPGQAGASTLASVGFGARMRLYDYVNGAVEDAIPLRSGPATHAGANRVLFRLYGDF